MDKTFKVGDRIQIKSLEEIKRDCYRIETMVIHGMKVTSFYEFKDGAIFTENMTPLCETFATIASIDEYDCVELTDFSFKGDTDWAFTLDMIKHPADENNITLNDLHKIKKQLKDLKDLVEKLMKKCENSIKEKRNESLK